MQHPVSASLYDASDPFMSMKGRSYPHTGSDYTTAFGEVYAVADMVIYHTGWDDGNGHYVAAYIPGHDWDDVEGGLYIAYLHLSSINVSVQQNVSQGQKIGVAGNSGYNCRGRHLHITMSNSDLAYVGAGKKVDPYAYIEKRLGAATKPKPAELPKPATVIPTPPTPPADPSKPVEPPKPAEPVKLSSAEKKAAIAQLEAYIQTARRSLAEERKRGKNADATLMAKYREQIAKNQTRIKNINRFGY